ncbi:Selenoprotein H [Bagarius yarrelli]|uniref:Selenoprotein H n=1 Tax=Bagarius yarrelli TaxID=175774 RepID=A0A556V5R8_BAGYA|nr:Selenoprotein H [Bagarius yarrelli]
MATRAKAGRVTKRKAEVLVEAEPVAKQDNQNKGEEEEDEGQRVVIEHWSVLREALLAAHPALRVLLNPQKPRRNSFEISLIEGSKEVVLWTGIKKGPPRKLKFPEPVEVVTALDNALKSK